MTSDRTRDTPGSLCAMRRKVFVGSFVGTTTEWYDFFIHGLAAALVLGSPRFEPLVPRHRQDEVGSAADRSAGPVVAVLPVRGRRQGLRTSTSCHWWPRSTTWCCPATRWTRRPR
jgi:hypothetical protein